MTKEIKVESFRKAVKNRINWMEYINAIQDTITDLSTYLGLQGNAYDRNRARTILQMKIKGLSETLIAELGMAGDPNISIMVAESMICCAWSNFILAAKSTDRARPKYQREEMTKFRKEMHLAFSDLIKQSQLFGLYWDDKKINRIEYMFSGLKDMEQ
jgi:hypothetical protein